MGNFFVELKRRHVYRVAAAYVVVAWLILQVVNNVAPGLNLPNSAVGLVIVLLAAGFPISLIFAWIFDLKVTSQADSRARIAKTTRLDIALTSALVVVIALVSYEQLANSRGERAVPVPQAGVEAARAAASVPAVVSIAVLPFTNLSSDAEQEFFSDGMTEEITSALAKVPGLIVIGRTSAFEFKGQNKDLRMIGQALGTTHLIEGSVRKAGNRVRITAQLIIADSGAHLWTENYDRELTDIFAVQEDIAEAIARALRVPLGLQQGDTLVRDRTNNPESYDQYLRARALFRARSPAFREGMIKILEPVVARDPGYAPAWALLGRAYGAQNPDKAEKATREALRLDPQNAMANRYLADMQAVLGNFAAAEDIQKQMLALHPDDTDVLDAFSNSLAIYGRVKEAVSMRAKLRTLEPFVPLYNYLTASILLNNGQSQAAIATLKALPAGPTGDEGARGITLARAYAMEGRYGEAADTLLANPQTGQQNRESIEDAARLLRAAPAKVSMPDALPAWAGELGFVYLYVGAPDRVLDHPERLVVVQGLSALAVRYLWSSEFAPIRKTERFKAFVRAACYVVYWRARGWPETCHPIGADDFVCE
jgi:TolB-like protein/Tfp pilus assembly protein PilF